MSLPAQGDVVAVVPLKALEQAKSRLVGHLDEASRRELAGWMFARVVGACRAASQVRAVLVVAGDRAAAGLAHELGVAVIVEPEPGLAAALGAADRATADAPATLVVAADLPLAGAVDIDTVCRAGRSGPCVVVAPTADGGTGALLRRPAGVIETAYGAESAAAHLQAAAAAGVRALRVDVPALGLDVDTAEQLRVAGSRDPAVARLIRGLSAG